MGVAAPFLYQHVVSAGFSPKIAKIWVFGRNFLPNGPKSVHLEYIDSFGQIRFILSSCFCYSLFL